MSPPPTSVDQLLALGENERLTVFRVVAVSDPAAPAYVESFKSHAEIGRSPRGPEQTHPIVYDGISVYETAEAAVQTAQLFPQIGSYVAQLDVGADTGVRYFRWGANGHLTLWAEPLTLAGTTVDIVPV